MNILEFLDRIGERRAARPQRPIRDIRQLIGFMFLAGYYVMVFQFARHAIPAENKDLIRDAMLTLGPPVGLIVGAMFRTDAREEQATQNTAKAFDAVTAAANAGTSNGGEPQPVKVVNAAGEAIPVEQQP